MGFDRGVLPSDRDGEETYPWMGLLAIVLIVGGLLLLVVLAVVVFGEAAPETFRYLIGI